MNSIYDPDTMPNRRRDFMNLQEYIDFWGIPEDEDPYLEKPEDTQIINPEEEGNQP